MDNDQDGIVAMHQTTRSIGRKDLHKDVVDGNVDQLDDKANNTHDEESHGHSLSDLKEFWMRSNQTKS